MIVVGLTGGIGSGKTTVAKQFAALGVPVYIADEQAKILMNTSKVIIQKLKALLGDACYVDNRLNKPFIANIIFNKKSYLKKVNAIVHPEVAKHFEQWKQVQNHPYVIKEVAILFENGGDKICDYILTVTAPSTIRIERLLKRDNTSKDAIKKIMENQWTDQEKIKHSHFVIQNIDLENTKKQVLHINKHILKKIEFS